MSHLAFVGVLISHQAPKVKLEEENRSLKQDKKKFDDVLQYYENRKRKVADAIRREQEEILEECVPFNVFIINRTKSLMVSNSF